MNLTELKQKPITELLEIAEQMGLENMGRSRKQDVIFATLKKHAKGGEDIHGDGVLEILQDGVSTCVPVTPSPAKFVHRKTVNAILRC